jgi:hypothetical protein
MTAVSRKTASGASGDRIAGTLCLDWGRSEARRDARVPKGPKGLIRNRFDDSRGTAKEQINA